MKRESQLVNMFVFAYIFYVFLFEIGNCVKVTDFTTIEVTIDPREHAHITSAMDPIVHGFGSITMFIMNHDMT